MNPLAIAAAFITFWLIIGLGLFLSLNSLAFLWRSRGGVAIKGNPHWAGPMRWALAQGLALLLILIGLALISTGGYATYTVIYR